MYNKARYAIVILRNPMDSLFAWFQYKRTGGKHDQSVAIDAVRRDRSQLQNGRTELARELKRRRIAENDLRQQVNRLGKEVARLETRRDMLDQLRQKATDVRGNAAVMGRLARLLTIPTEFSPAIEAALAAQ